MGLFSSIGSFLGFGGSGDGPYRSPNLGSTDEAAKSGIYNAIGAKKKADGSYDFSSVGAPITGAQGVKSSNTGYDFSGLDKAQSGFAAGPKALTQTYSGANYNPTQFNFSSLPQQYYDQAYQSGAKDLRRDAQGQITSLQQAIGTRRPGLLAKAGGAAQRSTGEQLASLQSALGQQRMQQENQNAIDQQKSQAGENLNAVNFNAGEAYKGYGSRSDLEKNNAGLSEDYLKGLTTAGSAKLSGQQSNVAADRAYQGSNLDRLLNYFNSLTGTQNAAAGNDTAKRGQTLGAINGLASAGTAAAALCLPKGTLIEIENGNVPVEDIRPGDKVNGGKVLLIGSRLRPENHQFYKHSFKTGDVVMSNGHPYYDELIAKEVCENPSLCTYDILTSEGFYFVNGVKLGSTL